MVRKITCIMVIVLICCSAMCGTAAAYTIYDGNISSSQLQYFRDLLPKVEVSDDYIVFRSSQYEYIMITGDLNIEDSFCHMESEKGTEYRIYTSNQYNSVYQIKKSEIQSFSLILDNNIIYSNLGIYPTLEERGSYFEIIQTIVIFATIVFFTVNSAFIYRKR